MVWQVQRGLGQAQLRQVRDLLPQKTQRDGRDALLLEDMDTAAVIRVGSGGVQLTVAHEGFKILIAPGKVPR